MNETIVRSAFGVVLTRVERRDAAGAAVTEYRLSLPSGGPEQIFASFADADAAWLFSLGGEPGGKPAPAEEAPPITRPPVDAQARSSSLTSDSSRN